MISAEHFNVSEGTIRSFKKKFNETQTNKLKKIKKSSRKKTTHQASMLNY